MFPDANLKKKVGAFLEETLKETETVEQFTDSLLVRIAKVPFLEIDIDTSLTYHEAKSLFLKRFLSRVLSLHLGNVVTAAKSLKIERRTLHRLIVKLGIPVENIRHDLVKKNYLQEKNIVSAIGPLVQQYAPARNQKGDNLAKYTEELSRIVLDETLNSKITLDEAERMFETQYFESVMPNYKTVNEASRAIKLRPETVCRKLKFLNIK